MPTLAVMVGVVAGYDVGCIHGARQKIRQAREGNGTVEVRGRSIVEMDEDFLIAPFKGVVAAQVGDLIGEIELVLRTAYAVLAAIPQAAR
jgi:hypothetical protein